MNIKKEISLLLCLLCFLGCHRRTKKNPTQINERGTKVNIVQKVEAGFLVCNVRIIPDGSFKNTNTISNNMYYHLDSCFKLKQAGTVDLFPLSVEPVVSGISRSFEFLVTFRYPEQKAFSVVYDDKYLGGERFKFDFVR